MIGDKNNLTKVSLIMLDYDVKAGDYLLIQVGNFAVEKIDKQRALKVIELQQALAAGDYERAAKLY